MDKEERINQFDPSGIGIKNGRFIGLPFDERHAEVVLLSVPWDLTVSYGTGTATGPQNILEASYQLDLYDSFVENAWKLGVFMRPSNAYWLSRNEELRDLAQQYVDYLEEGGAVEDDQNMIRILQQINDNCQKLKIWVKQETTKILDKGQLVGVVGGEHSVPLGLMEALAEKYDHFGILQIDAHLDLRATYEGFELSHASIMYHALKIPQIERLISVGIRDYCQEEVDFVAENNEKVVVFYDHSIHKSQFLGSTFAQICETIVQELPENVYISFDIDSLDPNLCPNTGTPVPGGLQFNQAIYLLEQVVYSGRTIVGFDLCEVAGFPNEYDGNVGARILYKLANLMGKSQGRI